MAGQKLQEVNTPPHSPLISIAYSAHAVSRDRPHAAFAEEHRTFVNRVQGIQLIISYHYTIHTFIVIVVVKTECVANLMNGDAQKSVGQHIRSRVIVNERMQAHNRRRKSKIRIAKEKIVQRIRHNIFLGDANGHKAPPFVTAIHLIQEHRGREPSPLRTFRRTGVQKSRLNHHIDKKGVSQSRRHRREQLGANLAQLPDRNLTLRIQGKPLAAMSAFHLLDRDRSLTVRAYVSILHGIFNRQKLGSRCQLSQFQHYVSSKKRLTEGNSVISSIEHQGTRIHIHFRLPNASMRRELFALHLPNPERVTADYAVLAELSKGISGGDILNICLNAIYAGSTDPNPEQWMVSQAMIEAEIAKAIKAKAEHSGEKRKEKRWIGFNRIDQKQNYF